MATRSMIGMREADGKIRAVYCHWDGYPTGVGSVLLEHWTDPEKVGRLLDLGDLSCIGPELGEEHDFDAHLEEHPDWCLAYHRDRKEDYSEAQRYEAGQYGDNLWDERGVEYLYLFDPASGGWQVAGVAPSSRGPFRDLESAIREEGPK